MKLTKLDLKSFKSWVNLTLETDAPRVLLAGINNSGKTSVREAIKWALTGRCQGLDGKGAGVQRIVPVGEPGAAVGVDLAGIGTAKRAFSGSTSAFEVSGFTGTSQIQQQALYAKLNTSPEFLDAVLDTETFVRLHHADAKALVLSLLNVRIQIEGDATAYTLEDLDRMYQAAFADRKFAKNKVRAFAMPDAPSDQALPRIPDIEIQLAQVRGLLEVEVRTLGTAAGRRQSLLEQQAKAKVSEWFTHELTEDQAVTTLAEAEERLALMEEEGQPTEETPASIGRSGETGQKIIIALRAHRPSEGCVLDGSIPCETAKVRFTKRAKDLEAEMASPVAQEPSRTRPEQRTVVTPSQTLRNEIRFLESVLGRYKVVREANEKKASELEAVTAQLASLPDTSEQEAAIAKLRQRISNGEDLLSRARSHWTAVDRYAKATAEKQTLQAEVDRLETLCEVLGPNGVRVQALSEAIGQFEAKVNPYLQPFGWTLAFTLDPWDVVMNHRSIDTFSESEQFRIGLGLQLAIASLSGLNFAIVDRLDLLDERNRALATQMLIQAPLEQIFILSTREPGRALPQAPGVLAYRIDLQKGRSVVTERIAA